MGNKENFVILALSDAHIGMPNRELDSLSVLQPFLIDLRRMVDKYSLMPDLIVVSGDIVYGQYKDLSIEVQYSEAEKFIKAIYEALNCKPEELPLLLVPGNHDINREKITDIQKQGRDNLTKEAVDKVLMGNASQDYRDIFRRQDAWFNFMKKFSFHWSVDETFLTSRGILHHDGLSIGVVGFNSSWTSHEQAEQGKIWIGKRQYEKAFSEIKDADFKIAVSHHPVSWLHPEDKRYMKEKISSQFHLFLHGHEHSDWYMDSEDHLLVEVGACYESSDKLNSYCWLEINFKAKSGKLYLREFSEAGKGGWRPRVIEGKTDTEGIGTIKNFLNTFQGNSTGSSSVAVSILKPMSVIEYIKVLEDEFEFRWEKRNFLTNGFPRVYWPVRLRRPTPIHAAQAFAAAGLQRQGCEICLWLDDLGTTKVQPHEFLDKINDWFARAGGDPATLKSSTFSAVKGDEIAWKMVQQWLTNPTYMTPRVLQISKIVKSLEAEDLLAGINKYRPRRLMTPAMVWACLVKMHHENNQAPIITLGGYDECGLWSAWWDCSGIQTAKVGNLFGPELRDITAPSHSIHMKEIELCWTSKKDIEKILRESLVGLNENVWRDDGHIIPWCINNCVLLPSRVKTGIPSIVINGNVYHSLDEVKLLSPKDIIDDIVKEVYKWLLA